MQLKDFQMHVWEYYASHGRHDLPWRLPKPNGAFDPYAIMVSEIMLQQTQVQRVIPKFNAFMQQYPTAHALSQAPLADVLTAWSGLGYNRRAKFLWQAAHVITHELKGKFPNSLPDLIKLPGVGVNTAGAILAYAFDQPVIFLETNIRTIYIHHFFADADTVADASILPYIEESIQAIANNDIADLRPRTWYWALMDYGTFLKQTIGNQSRRSSGYSKQSAFAGSRRQVRGAVLRQLKIKPHTFLMFQEIIVDERLESVLQDLVSEKMISYHEEHYQLGDIMVQF